MKVTIELQVQPFSVPNFILTEPVPGARQDGFKESPSYPLSDFDAVTLQRMCDEFTAEIFRKAGKNPPPKDNP